MGLDGPQCVLRTHPQNLALPSRMGVASSTCCSIHECCPLTAARNCRISFVLSVLPAPDSPLQRVAGQASVLAVPLAAVSHYRLMVWSSGSTELRHTPPLLVLNMTHGNCSTDTLASCFARERTGDRFQRTVALTGTLGSNVALKG